MEGDVSNNVSRSTQWSEEPAKQMGPKCGTLHQGFPAKVCTLSPGHAGDHCNKTQAGTRMIEYWWSPQTEKAPQT